VFSAASVCQFVCLSVTSFICQHDNFRTIERKMMKLNGWVHCTKISTEFEFGGRRSKVRLTRDKKRQGAAFFREQSLRVRSSGALRAVYVWETRQHALIFPPA